MTLPRSELKRRSRRFKRRKKEYKWPGGLGSGPHAAHPGIGFGESLLKWMDWDDVPNAVKSAMAYELMSEVKIRHALRNMLSEVDASGVREVHIYDFDGTLFDTPTPDAGKMRWKDVTGDEWSHRGWWGRPESLNVDVFDIKPKPDVLSQFMKSSSDPDVHVMVLTGRSVNLRPQVEAILAAHGISPDELKLTPSGMSTQVYKSRVVRKLVHEHAPDRVVMWEDRPGHVAAFRALNDELDVDIVVNYVPSDAV